MKKWIFSLYTNTMREISRTGIARAILPLWARRWIGGFLRSIVVRTVALESEGPYEILGHRMWLDKSSPSSLDMAYGTFERDTVEVFRKTVKPGMTLVDVGTHVGFYTLLAARLVGPHGRVYAFEPNPDIFQVLCRNVEENGYQDIVKLFPRAVSDREGKARLYIPQDEKGEASFFSDDRQKWQEVEVETITLDNFFAREGWPRVDVIKIDVEGSEVAVLKGMRELIHRNDGLKLIVEFNPEFQMKAYGNYTRFFETLLGLGFKRFHAIRHGLKSVRIPDDIEEELVRMTETTRHVNLLCEI